MSTLNFGSLSYWVWYLFYDDPWCLTYQFTVSGPLDTDRFKLALSKVVDANDAFSGRFSRWSPVRKLCEPRNEYFEYIDVANLAKQDQSKAINTNRDWQKPLNADASPLLRVVVFRLGQGLHHIAITYSHLVVDGTGIELFQRELLTTYLALGRDPLHEVEPMACTLREFADSERTLLGGKENFRNCVGYWRNELYGARSFTLPRRFVEHDQAARSEVTVSLPKADYTSFSNTAASIHVSPQMLLVAAIIAALVRMNNQNDVTIHVLRDERTTSAVSMLIGQLSAEVPVRAKLSQATSVGDLAQMVRDALIRSYAYRNNALPEALLFRQERPFVGRLALWLSSAASLAISAMNPASELDWRILRYFFVSTLAWGWGARAAACRSGSRKTRVLINLMLNNSDPNLRVTERESVIRMEPTKLIDIEDRKDYSRKCLNFIGASETDGGIRIILRGGGLTSSALTQLGGELEELVRSLKQPHALGEPALGDSHQYG